MAGDLVELCGLWWQEKDGKRYLSGSLGGARVLIFENTFKNDPKQPDMRIMLAAKREREHHHETQQPPPGGSHGGRTNGGDGAGNDPF